MNLEQAKEKLEKFGQMQVLKYFDDLTADEKEKLLNEIEKTDFSVIRKGDDCFKDCFITPMGAMCLPEIEKKKAELEEKGLEAIRKGKLSLVLLAGGQGTRLGIDGPKGTFKIGLTKDLYIFQCLINNLLEVKEKAGVWIPLAIMTSDINNKATVAFFEEHDYFGYNKDEVYFFIQEMAPATDYDGKVYMESKSHIALSPNGNGGWFKSMQNAGLVDKMKAKGAEWINIFSVDNVLQRMADPVFFGAALEAGVDVGSKVIAKAAPDEKVGVMCYRNGKPSIVEYYELTPEMMSSREENGDLSYNYGVTLNYIFKISALEKIAERNLPLHVVEKKIPHLDENGNPVKPEAPNGHKYEGLVLDMIEMMDSCLAFEVDRAKEFAPVKNMHGVDSADSAREMLKANGVEL